MKYKFTTNRDEELSNIYKQIENYFSQSDLWIWIYEERPWKETVFCYNIFKNEELPDLKYLNKPFIWRVKR